MHVVIEAKSDETAAQKFNFGVIDLSFGGLLPYNMRHVPHHATQ